MKAVAVFPQTRQIAMIDLPEPHIMRPEQIKVRMLEVGLCGTDKEICAFVYGTPPPHSDFLVIGHESLGEVIEIGSAVKHIQVGDLVVAAVRRPCPHNECAACRAGYPDFCSTGDYRECGIKGEHGFMTEFIVDDERFMQVAPPELRHVAVLTEPLTVAEKAAAQARQVINRFPWVRVTGANPHRAIHRHGLKAVVLGAGPVGLLGAMELLAQGWETYVYARPAAPNPAEAIVTALGGKYVSEGLIPDDLRQDLFGHINLVYEATGASRLAFEAMKLLGPNSIFIFTGVPSHNAPIEIDADWLMRNIVLKNQLIFGTVNASMEDFGEAIKDLGVFSQRWPRALSALITRHDSFEDVIPLLTGKMGGVKNVIHIADPTVIMPEEASHERFVD